MSPVVTTFSRDWEQSTVISSWAANVDRAVSVASSSRGSSVISDVTLVDNSDSFFVAGTIKVKATISAFANTHSRHGNCPACKAKRLALATQEQQQQKKRDDKVVADKAKNARPAWRY